MSKKLFLVKEGVTGFILGSVRVDSLPKNANGRFVIECDPASVQTEIITGLLVEEKASQPIIAPAAPALPKIG